MNLKNVQWNRRERTLGYFFDKYQDELLNLRPAYQRLNVWGKSKMCEFIENILSANTPFEIKINKKPDSIKEDVLDGQQRLTAAFLFLNGDLTAKSALTSSKITYDGLSTEDKDRLLSFSISELQCNVDDETAGELFVRYNGVQQKVTAFDNALGGGSGKFKDALQELGRQLPIFESLILGGGKTKQALRTDLMLLAEFEWSMINGLEHNDTNNKPMPRPKKAAIWKSLFKQFKENFPERAQIESRVVKAVDLWSKLVGSIDDKRYIGNYDMAYFGLTTIDELLQEGYNIHQDLIRPLAQELKKLIYHASNDYFEFKKPAGDALALHKCWNNNRDIADSRNKAKAILKRFILRQLKNMGIPETIPQ